MLAVREPTPPRPVPRMTPVASARAPSRRSGKPADSMASCAATSPNAMYRSVRRNSLRSRTWLASKSWTSAAIFELTREASNASIGRTALRPAAIPAQVLGTSLPIAVEDVAGRAAIDDLLEAEVADLGHVGVAAADEPGVGARQPLDRDGGVET